MRTFLSATKSFVFLHFALCTSPNVPWPIFAIGSYLEDKSVQKGYSIDSNSLKSISGRAVEGEESGAPPAPPVGG